MALMPSDRPRLTARDYDAFRTIEKPPWNGLAEVRSGSFTSFAPSRRVRFAPRADILPKPAFMSTRPTSRPKINLLKSRRSAHAGCRAVRDSTLVAWYRSLYAPRTGGAYDSHHRTAGTDNRTRRRGGVAARGARAAIGPGAADRCADERGRRRSGGTGPSRGVFSRARRTRLDYRPQR